MDIVKDEYKIFEDQINVNNNNRKKIWGDEDASDEDKRDESKNV